jgi:O-antigen/teichoic acid export membrane protein
MTDDALAAPGALTRSTIVGAAWLLLWRTVTRSLGLISTLVLARLLLPSDFGLIGMASAFAGIVESMSQLGLQDALVRRRRDGFELHHTAFTLQFGRALITGALVAAAAPAAAAWFSEPRLVGVLHLLGAVMVLNGLENVGVAEYRRTMRFDVQFKLLSAARLAGFATTLAGAIIFRNYWALPIGVAVQAVVRVGMSYALHPFRPRIRLHGWRELAHFSFWTWATVCASLVWDRCDPFVLGPSFGPAKLGIYLLAMEIALLPVTELVAPAADALFAAFARAQKDGDSSAHHAPDVAGLIQLAVAPIVLSVSAASGPIVEVLLGAKWTHAWPITAVLTWACIFSPFSYICSSALVANGYVQRNFVANAVVSAIKLAALLAAVLLTSDPVIIGAVAAACVAIESVTFLGLLRGTGAIELRPAFGGLVRTLAGLTTAALAAYFSGLGWHPGLGDTLTDLAAGCLTGVVACAVFGATVLACWLAAGRPPGPETRLVRLVRERLVGVRLPGWVARFQAQ